MNIKDLDFKKLKEFQISIDDNPEINFNKFNDLISDYSGIFIEFAIIKKKFPFLVNLKKKILNKNFHSYKNIDTIEDKFKTNCSHRINTDQLNSFIEIIKKRNLDNEKNSSFKFNKRDYFLTLLLKKFFILFFNFLEKATINAIEAKKPCKIILPVPGSMYA